MPTATSTPTHRYIGLTDEQDTCDHCDKQGLQRVVVLALLDTDGNDTEIVRYGTTCAARALGVRGGARTVRDLAGFAHRETIANAEYARELLAHYGVEADGTITHKFGFTGVAMDYEVKHRDSMWNRHNPLTPAQWAEKAQAFIDHRVAQIAEAALIGA